MILNNRNLFNKNLLSDNMSSVLERFMDEETIRIFCFFLRNKYSPYEKVCQGCARRKLCERDARKMISFLGDVPWWGEEIKTKLMREFIEQRSGKQRCESCAF